MEQYLEEKQPGFLDYRIKHQGILGAKGGRKLKPGDIVSDGSNIIGQVQFVHEKFGAWIEFVDGYSAYDKELKVSKMSATTPQLFAHHQKYYGFITRLGRIIEESIKDSFPAVKMMSDGSTVSVRGSTMGGIVKGFTQQRIGDNHSFFEARLTSFYNCEITSFDVKKSKRKSRYTYDTLKRLFVDIDLKMKQANRIRFTVKDETDYNEKHWLRIKKQFGKFGIRYIK